VSALATTFRGAFAEAWSNRRGFWAQMTMMVVNDAVWIVFWVLFFDRVGAVRGWDITGVLMLQAVLTTSGGIVLGLLANARSVGRLAADGALDAALALPVPTLPYLLVRRVEPVNVGDLVFGVVLFAVACDPTPQRVAVFLLTVLAAATVLAGFLVTMGSLSFFVGRNDIGEVSFHAMLLFSAYPAEVFTGTTRIVMYTAIPAAFVAAVPARLIAGLDLSLALGLGAAAAVCAAAAYTTFTIGLRRYTSGAVWTRA
jgi:ABC-2 type transport system permease protein